MWLTDLVWMVHRYVNLSAVLDFDKAAAIKPGHLPPVTLRSGTAFVFGGDCFDQGAVVVNAVHMQLCLLTPAASLVVSRTWRLASWCPVGGPQTALP